MTAEPVTPAETSSEEEAARRKRVKRNALFLALVAFCFYAGFILMGVLRA